MLLLDCREAVAQLQGILPPRHLNRSSQLDLRRALSRLELLRFKGGQGRTQHLQHRKTGYPGHSFSPGDNGCWILPPLILTRNSEEPTLHSQRRGRNRQIRAEQTSQIVPARNQPRVDFSLQKDRPDDTEPIAGGL